MTLPASTIQKISEQISRQYPEVKGIRPRVHQQVTPAKANKGQVYQLNFETTVTGSDGKRIKRWVKVVVDENGKILRTSTSR